MSRDIRSYLFKSPPISKPDVSSKPVKNSKKLVISSDEDEPHGSQSPPKTKAKVTKKTKKHVLSDSDDDEVFQKKKSSPSSSRRPEKDQKLKPVTLDSMFSKNPIKRKNAPVASNSKKLQKQEAEFHDDDEFEKTLNQIDTDEMDLLLKKAVGNGKRKKSQDEETPPKKIKLSNGDKEIAVPKDKDDGPSTSSKEKEDKSPKSSKENGDKSSKSSKEKDAIHSSSSKGKDEKYSKPSKENDDKLSKPSKEKQNSKSSKSNFEMTVEKPIPKEKAHEEIPDPFEESIAKKKQHASTYQKYLHRGGARNPGSKPIPEGAPNCLAGLTFVITGVLDSLEREEADELIKKYGGRIVAAVSGKTNYLIIGDEAGASKMVKAAALGVKKITEDELLDLIRTRPERKAREIIPSRSKKMRKSPLKESDTHEKSKLSRKSSIKNEEIKTEPKSEDEKDQFLKENEKSVKENDFDVKPSTSFDKKSVKEDTVMKTNSILQPATSFSSSFPESGKVGETEALVEKYRPKVLKQIIGQHTDKSSAKKLYSWLVSWHKNQSGKVKLTKPSPWAKNDDGAFYKAALLSGPPGVGKTTTVQVVCHELGFDLVEFNASDTRSKRLLKEDVSTLLSNTSVKGYFSTGGSSKTSTKHVLLMDEVDGMAGNEDRGGLQEMISLIKSTDVPIICICNDRNNPKMRTLANYTFDLRFQKPKLEQIRGAMKSLCCKENINISTDNLDRLIQSTNFDIRQVINHLAMLVSKAGDDKEKISDKINKDLKLGPWDVCRKVFSAEEHKNMTIHDKSNLFFHDYNISGLFVQENYLSVVPKAPKTELLDRVASAAESLAIGDVIENKIRSASGWSLLPVQACFSTVIPGSVMSGHITAQINFPGWLGRNSKRMKFDRLLQEITVHTRLTTGASKEAINIDYLVPLRDKIVRPLVTMGSEGVDVAVDAMNHYHLLRDDLDSLVETSLWPGQRDPMQCVDSKVKAAFTRSYNKNSKMTPFTVNSSKKKDTQASQDEGFITGEGEDQESEKEDDLEVDRMVKAKKPIEKKTASTSKAAKEKPASKRGRGRGRGK